MRREHEARAEQMHFDMATLSQYNHSLRTLVAKGCMQAREQEGTVQFNMSGMTYQSPQTAADQQHRCSLAEEGLCTTAVRSEDLEALRRELEQSKQELESEKVGAAKTSGQLKRLREAVAKRERVGAHVPKHHLYQQFKENNSGQLRTASAAQRAAQRAVKSVVEALPEDDEQAAMVLDTVLKRRPEAAAEAGIRTIGDVSMCEEAMRRAKEACTRIMDKQGGLTCEEQTALDTYLTFIAPEENSSKLRRGKHAKRQRSQSLDETEEGAAPTTSQKASVTNARGWARLLGMSKSTTWRHLKSAVDARAKLDDVEQKAYWLQTKRRTGHGLSEELVELVHNFYIGHPAVKRSPIAKDVLWIKTGPEKQDREKVAKLLSEVSLTDIYLDFKQAHPLVKIGERSFRKLRPLELRRMKQRHLDMCGCRWCVEMRIAQEALNRARRQLQQAYTPSTVAQHLMKPSEAVKAALCKDADGEGGESLEHPKLR